MKKILTTLLVIISITTTVNGQEFLGKVSAQELANNKNIVMYYNNLSMETDINSLPEDEMIRIMKAIDRQCESNYLLNLVYRKQRNNNILKQAFKENVIVVSGKSLIDWNKTLKRFNELKPKL